MGKFSAGLISIGPENHFVITIYYTMDFFPPLNRSSLERMHGEIAARVVKDGTAV